MKMSTTITHQLNDALMVRINYYGESWDDGSVADGMEEKLTQLC